ncbi:zinc finger BED domain-containing protein 4-like [Misgurnus anguillicaudatus]|uniref:zinc finger BED domain-containing protein 4-like n=1 Tax=Misgurnus anguillicaudatus TaxID=75329 RepID=UPI003CCF0907
MSFVWKHFEICEHNVKIAICKVCKGQVNRGGTTAKTFGTSNLIRHLKIHHPKEHDEYLKSIDHAKQARPSLTQPSMKSVILRNQSYSRDSPKAQAITKKVMEFIVLDDQPFSVVEDQGFRRLMAHMDPRYTLPSRRYFSDVALPEIYNAVSAHVHSLLNAEVRYISFTTDIWRVDVSPISMLSLTAQFIDADFELQKVILHAHEFSGSHTASALVMAFEEMLKTWNISKSKVHVIVRDNAANMCKAMKDADLPNLPCMAHTLQLAVHEWLLSQHSVTDIVATGRKIVGHFKHSPLAYSRLQNAQAQLSQLKKRLQQDVPTRWDSTYYMLSSLMEQKHALGAYAVDYELPVTLTSYQWGLIENILTVLAPFEVLTKEASSSLRLQQMSSPQSWH